MTTAGTCLETLTHARQRYSKKIMSQPWLTLPGSIYQEELMPNLQDWTFGKSKSIDCREILQLSYRTLIESTFAIQIWCRSLLTTLDKPFPLLEYFSTAEKCKLISIDGNLFRHNPKLKVVAFQDTFIEHIGFDLLTNLKELRVAGFLKNVCVNISADTPQAIQELSLKLSTSCPPLIIECPEMCRKRMESTEKEFAAVKENLAQHGERIVDLEKQIRELSARPW